MNKKCPDCGVKHGELHDPGCDIDTCVCGIQKIQCDKHDDKPRVPYGFEPTNQNDLWLEFYLIFDKKHGMGLCGLCNNSGFVELKATSAATGETKTDRKPCICPNGRAIKAQRKGKNG